MIIKKLLSTRNCYINKNKPKYIVIHETDNTSKGANAKRHAQATYNGNLKTSVHYYVDDTDIYQTLDHKNGAYAVGDNNNKVNNSLYGIHNQNSINIEICVNSDNDYYKSVSNTIELVKYLMKIENISINNVVRHYDATRKNCPRRLIGEKRWDVFKSKLKALDSNIGLNNGDYKGRLAIINADVLNVRYDRGTNHKIIGKLYKNDVVKLNYCLDKWVSIEGYKGKKGLGYINSKYIEII